MAILAALICTHGGKALLARLFRDMPKDRITALLANFPALVADRGGQNTTVEDDSVRYVYQPLEELYVVLLTNKQSNILQDIDTLHLFVSVVLNMVRVADEKEIFDNAFEIVSAFDEIVVLGYKERLTMSQVQTFLEMDSHEEKIQEIIERNKEMEATEERHRRAKEIQRKELARRNMEAQQAAFAGNSGFGNNAYNSANSSSAYPAAPSYELARFENDHVAAESSPAAAPARPVGRGLQLGKKPARVAQPEANQPLLTTKPPVFANAAPLAAAAGPAPGSPAPLLLNLPGTPEPVSGSGSPAPAVSAQKATNNGILITMNERVSAEISREGGVVASEVKGDLQLRIVDAELARCRILLAVDGAAQGVQYKTHPNVDKTLFSKSSVVGLRDPTKPFPSNDQNLGILRWRAVGKDDDASLVPLVLTTWVSEIAGGSEVTLEYELTLQYLEQHPVDNLFGPVQIRVPVVLDDVELQLDSLGNVAYDVTEEGIIFTIAEIDQSGSFAFTIPAEEEALFPMDVEFEISRLSGVTEADQAFGGVRVLDVVSNDADEELLPFDLHSNVVSEAYSVV